MIIYTIEEKVFVQKQFLEEPDPLTGSNGIEMEVTQSYARWILPIFPNGKKKVRAYSLANGEPIPVTIWTPSMQQKAEAIKSEAKGTWKLFSLLIALAILMLGGLVYKEINKNSVAGQEKMQTTYRNSPQEGDLLLVKVNLLSSNSIDDNYLTVLKVIRKDRVGVYVKRLNEQLKNPHLYTLADFKKQFGEFKISDDAFNPEEELFISTGAYSSFQPNDSKMAEEAGYKVVYVDRP